MNTNTSLKVFKFLAGFVSVYHFILGLIGTFASSDTILWVINKVYGVSPNIDAQFFSLVKFIAIYMIVFAIAMAFLAWKPLQYSKLVWLAIILFAVRIVERLVFFDVLQSAYKIDMAQNLRVVIPITILAIALYYFRPRPSIT